MRLDADVRAPKLRTRSVWLTGRLLLHGIYALAGRGSLRVCSPLAPPRVAWFARLEHTRSRWLAGQHFMLALLSLYRRAIISARTIFAAAARPLEHSPAPPQLLHLSLAPRL